MTSYREASWQEVLSYSYGETAGTHRDLKVTERKTMITIGLLGRARSGKTSIADSVVDHAVKLGYTARVYDIGRIIMKYCVDENLIADQPRESLTPGELKTLVDTGLKMREYDPEFWLYRVYARMIFDMPDVAIIPNIRYDNEISFVQKHGGVNVYVKSLNENGSEFISTDRDPNHVSECGIDTRRADFFITVKRGDLALAKAMGNTVFDHLLRRCVN